MIDVALNLILHERRNQKQKGYDAEHDLRYSNGELLVAAEAMIEGSTEKWPWAPDTFPFRNSKVEELAVGAALLLAEIDRLALVQLRAGGVA